MYVYIYIYIYIHRERDVCVYLSLSLYIYIERERDMPRARGTTPLEGSTRWPRSFSLRVSLLCVVSCVLLVYCYTTMMYTTVVLLH